MNVPRWLSPKTNPALYTAAIGVLFSIWQALQVQAASGPLTWSQVGRVAGGVIFAAVVYGPHRRATTPVADPRDGNGKPLLTANAYAAENFRRATERPGYPVVLSSPNLATGVTDPPVPPPEGTAAGTKP